jgi:hypothetical protein
MLTVENFLDAGYKKFKQTFLNNADFGLQKCIRDDNGKKYYITVFVYENFNKPYMREYSQDRPYSFSPDVQFEGKVEGDPTVDISLIVDNSTTIQIIEDKFEMLWKVLGEVYYERYYGEE